MDALVLVGTAAEYRRGTLVLYRLLHNGMNLVVRHGQFAQELFHQTVGIHCEGFKHHVACLGGSSSKRFGDLFAAGRFAVLAVKVDRFHRDQIDHALEVVFLADGDLERNRIAAKFVSELLYHAIKIGTGAVHLVDKRQSRHLVSLHLPVDCHRLALYATNGAKHQNRPVQHA